MPRAKRSDPARRRLPGIIRGLQQAYPEATISLDYSTPFECAVATILSAQSTDVKVNEVTQDLFRKYRGPEDYLAVPEEELQDDIHATGFFRQKTKALRGMAQKLLEDFDGELPTTIAGLTSLPGVARKTANVVQSAGVPAAHKKDPDAGIAVDTHVGRLAVRLGFTSRGSKDAKEIERDLMKLVPKKEWPRLPFLLIEHGRRVCIARKPRCEDCVIEPLCPSSQEAGMPDLYRLGTGRKVTGGSGAAAGLGEMPARDLLH